MSEIHPEFRDWSTRDQLINILEISDENLKQERLKVFLARFVEYSYTPEIGRALFYEKWREPRILPIVNGQRMTLYGSI